MKLHFYKYQATGNDFIMIDNRNKSVQLSKEQVYALCDRHLGIGADGLILLSPDDDSDFYMTYFNSDGNESTMCGNGGRCITAFASMLKLIGKAARFNAIDGLHQSTIAYQSNKNMHIRLKMTDVDKIIKTENSFTLNTGSPHWVTFAEKIGLLDMVKEGREIRYSSSYVQEGINVNYAEIHDDFLFIRTYERGVEEETLSCGTGVTASALVYSFEYHAASPVKIKTKGGDLKVSFTEAGGSYQNIWLEGPAKSVFEGDIEI